MKICSIDKESLEHLFIVACRVKAQEGSYDELDQALFKASLSLRIEAMRSGMKATGFSHNAIETRIALESADLNDRAAVIAAFK